MKTMSLFTAGIAMTLMTACSPSVKVDGSSPNSAFGTWPDYTDQNVSGQVFGKEWKATTAVVKSFGQSGSEVSLEFYAETVTDACKSVSSTTKPTASVVIPAAYSQTEYRADMSAPGGGNPLMFSSFENGGRNVMAEKTKVRINNITATGFNVSVFAKGTESDGTVSEINGKLDVVDCKKAVDFSVWDEFANWWDLVSFDGAAVTRRTAIVEYNSSDIFSRSSNKYIKTLMFPLYRSVSSNSDMSTDLGPMQGLGSTTLTESGTVKTLTYSYHGPVTYKGVDVTLNLDMTVVKNGNRVTVDYTLEIPSHITKTAHKFELQK
ncbi:hypothetical protein [Bdellovibrio sp. HCB337]|uniref:hypothetical protein n=1 Tax=Bdellovibrio sp. HCB337 TaxID=3394358 RepID=UPI0039A442F4